MRRLLKGWIQWMAAFVAVFAAILSFHHAAAAPPTPTLPPPPPGGGLVLAEELVVRAGPGVDYARLGDLTYGEEITPLGRSSDGLWILIDWQGRDGWVSRGWVLWHPDMDTYDLPVATIAPSATPEDTDTPEPTITPAETATVFSTSSPAPTSTPVPQPTAVPTEEAGVVAAPSPSPVPPSPQPEPTTIPDSVEPSLPEERSFPIGWGIGIGLLVALVAGIYFGRLFSDRRELRRYADGFPMQECPVCQVGHLTLEENTRRLLGITMITRLVRCDSCRSVLRQTQPGQWRYFIDAFINPELAESYNGQTLEDGALLGFSQKARQFQPVDPLAGVEELSPEFQDALEHLEELEATVIASQEEMNAAVQQEAAQSEAGDVESESSSNTEDTPSEEETGPEEDISDPGENEDA